MLRLRHTTTVRFRFRENHQNGGSKGIILTTLEHFLVRMCSCVLRRTGGGIATRAYNVKLVGRQNATTSSLRLLGTRQFCTREIEGAPWHGKGNPMMMNAISSSVSVD